MSADDKSNGSMGAWQAIRDVAIESIKHGQLLLALFGLCMLVLLFRMPSEKLGTVAELIITNLLNVKLIGWCLFPASLLGWAWHAKRQRKIFDQEITRITNERNDLQAKLTDPKKIQSTRAKKTSPNDP